MAQAFGMIGLEVMGRNMALNMDRNGYPIAVYNRTWAKTEHFLNGLAKGKNAKGGKTIQEFVHLLDRPRRILLMVKAGGPVDAVIEELKPYSSRMTSSSTGATHCSPTPSAGLQSCKPTGINFFGMGVSGGEEGRLGAEHDAGRGRGIVQASGADPEESGGQDRRRRPVRHVHRLGRIGHFVKMVHNGIEYGDMQLIAEAYDLLKNVGGLNNRQLKDVFLEWNESELKSFLIEITTKVIDFADPDGQGSRWWT